MKLWLKILMVTACLKQQQCLSQVIESNSARPRNFAFEVKNIEEFLERFNNDPKTFISIYLKQNYPGTAVDRKALVENLFDRRTGIVAKSDREAFVGCILGTYQQAVVDFETSPWFAEVACKFVYLKKSIDVTIVLRVKQHENGALSWVIASAYSNSIYVDHVLKNTQTASDGTRFINVASHATNFLALSSVFSRGLSLSNYLDTTSFYNSPSSMIFLDALKMGQLRFAYVSKVRYHFFQVPEWTFTVDRFQRQSVNSGWLISSLQHSSSKEKEAAIQKLLHIETR